MKIGGSQFQLLTCFPLISHTLLYEIVPERLHYHEICARWVPKVLIDKKKKKKHVGSLTLLQQYNNKVQKLLDHTLTGDETWISYSNIETRKQIQKHSGLPKPKIQTNFL